MPKILKRTKTTVEEWIEPTFIDDDELAAAEAAMENDEEDEGDLDLEDDVAEDTDAEPKTPRTKRSDSTRRK